jgi:DNA-binding ferritin-like protein (Dps family)
MDALKIKIEWKLDRILCDVVGISQTDDGYQITAKTIQSSHLTTKEKGHAVTRLLSEVIDNWNATHTEQRLNRKLLQEDALTFVAKLLSSRLKLNVKVKDDFIDIADNQPAVNLLTKHSKRGAVGLAKLVQAIDTDQANEPEEEQPKKKDAVAMLKQAWLDADKPCNFDDVLAMFLPDRQYIEDENGYSVAALVMGIRANFGAGNLRVA